MIVIALDMFRGNQMNRTNYALEFRNPVTQAWVRLAGYVFASATEAIMFRLSCLDNIRAQWRWTAI